MNSHGMDDHSTSSHVTWPGRICFLSGFLGIIVGSLGIQPPIHQWSHLSNIQMPMLLISYIPCIHMIFPLYPQSKPIMYILLLIHWKSQLKLFSHVINSISHEILPFQPWYVVGDTVFHQFSSNIPILLKHAFYHLQFQYNLTTSSFDLTSPILKPSSRPPCPSSPAFPTSPSAWWPGAAWPQRRRWHWAWCGWRRCRCWGRRWGAGEPRRRGGKRKARGGVGGWGLPGCWGWGLGVVFGNLGCKGPDFDPWLQVSWVHCLYLLHFQNENCGSEGFTFEQQEKRAVPMWRAAWL